MAVPQGSKPSWWPTAWWISPLARLVEFVAVIGAMAGLVWEFWEERPKDRELRDVRLHATVATLAANPNAEAASHAVQRILGLMHRDRVDMTGISVPGIVFRMAEFERVDWSDAHMDDAAFTCADRELLVSDLRSPFVLGSDPACALLRHARFHAASLRNVRFQQADLTHANFVNARLSGLDAEGVDFSHAEFALRGSGLSYRAVLDCHAGGERCVSMKRVVFQRAHLRGAIFQGAKITDADFTRANMWSARFECQKKESGEKAFCTTVTDACFEHADLSDASFTGVTITNSDFSSATLDGAEFKNVRFDKVVFPTDLEEIAKFDAPSRASLQKARVKRTLSWTICTEGWRSDLAPVKSDSTNLTPPPSPRRPGLGGRSRASARS